MIIPHGVPAKSCNVFPQSSVDNCSRSGHGRPVAAHPRKAPGRGAVPEVLHGGIVVQSNSKREILFEQLSGIGVADIRVVPAEVVVLATVRHLHETPDMRCPGAGEEQRRLLRKFKTAVLGPRFWSFRRGEGSIE